ncbi:MAG: SPOR domain-containing protein [Pseudomonadota bacterium]
MERRQQERLVGAVVVVVAAAVVVPWLLDGSPERWAAEGREPPLEPQRLPRRKIHLDEPSTAPAVAQPMPLGDGEPEAPEPVVEEPSAAVTDSPGGQTESQEGSSSGRDEREPQVAVAAPERRPEATTEASPPPEPITPPPVAPEPEAPAPAGVDTGWAVQVGSFRDKGNAQGLVDTLSRKGYRAFLSRHTRANEVWYRVRVGTEQTRAGADGVAARLRRDGQLVATVVRHP